MPPLIVRLLLDAQSELMRAADAVPVDSRDASGGGLNTPGWIVAHAAEQHDAWLNVDAQGRRDEDGDAWSLAWRERQRESGHVRIEAPFEEARAALDRVFAHSTAFVDALTDADLEVVPEGLEQNGWPAGIANGITVGYLVARSAAHLFVHAAELNLAATASGTPDMGLPGRLEHTRGAPAGRAGDMSS